MGVVAADAVEITNAGQTSYFAELGLFCLEEAHRLELCQSP